MVINGYDLLMAAPIKDMLTAKVKGDRSSHGLAEVGYDIRLKQDIQFSQRTLGNQYQMCNRVFMSDMPMRVGRGNRTRQERNLWIPGNFCLASAMEEFQMPDNLVGVVHDKSTWARHGLSVLNTVIEPGWKGFLTLELVYHGRENLHLPAGSGIAQVIFHQTSTTASYEGKYQNQADRPVPASYD